MGSDRSSLRTWVVLGVVVALCIGLVVLSAISWGRGGRGQFSPDLLQCRTHSEYLIPGIMLPVWQSGYEYHRPELVQFLIDEELWTEFPATIPRWMPGFHWNEQWRDGENPYYKELGREEFWIDWTRTHSELATVVWPNFLELLRQNKIGEAELLIQFARRDSATVAGLQQIMRSEFSIVLRMPEPKAK